MNNGQAESRLGRLGRIVLPFLIPVLLWSALIALTFYFPRVATTLTKDTNGNVDARYETKFLFRFTIESGASTSVSGVEYDRQTWMGSFEADPPFEVELEDSGHARLIQEWLNEDSNRREFRVVSHRLFVVEVLVFSLAVMMTCFTINNAAVGTGGGHAVQSNSRTDSKWKELFADEYFTKVVVDEEVISVKRQLPLAATISIGLLFAIGCGLYGNFFISVLFIPGILIGLVVAARIVHKMGYMSEFKIEIPKGQLRWRRMVRWQSLRFDEVEEFYGDSVEGQGEPGFAAGIAVKTKTGAKYSLYETLSAKRDMQSAREHFDRFAEEMNGRLSHAGQ